MLSVGVAEICDTTAHTAAGCEQRADIKKSLESCVGYDSNDLVRRQARGRSKCLVAAVDETYSKDSRL